MNVLRHGMDEANAVAIERLFAMSKGVESPGLLKKAIEHALEVQHADRDEAQLPRAEAAARTLRVDAERVNSLVGLTGELIVAKNGIAHIAKIAEETRSALAPSLRKEHARLERLIMDLQHSVLSLRVLPLRIVFHRFLRVVREMAVALEKPTNLVLEGENTEADKAIVEMLFEPLLHVVRNAMDHGIESAGERSASSKPAVATIRLRAVREGEHVIVEIIDDGRGVATDRVRAVAIERGVADAETISAMSDQDAVDLIFAPGFSTAHEVTNLSGRGVGMDAVRTAVEHIGGRVTIESEAGRGTTVRLMLPFSVMMTRVMTVEAGGQTFGIPLDAVIETIRIPRDRVQPIGTAGAFVVRNRTIPLVDLSATLGRAAPPKESPELVAVIASIAGQLGAVEVDRVGERMDVMMKPIEGLLAGTPGLAGTTLMGDGQVLLILDLQELLA
jgi:two-component system chemotaxis sensor kinase CheA